MADLMHGAGASLSVDPGRGNLLLGAAYASGVVLLVVGIAALRPEPPFASDEQRLAQAGDEGDDDDRTDAVDTLKSKLGAGSASKPDIAPIFGDDDDELPPMTSAESREAFAGLEQQFRLGNLKGAVIALDKLLKVEPRAAEDKEVRARIIDLAVRVMFLQGKEPELMFEWLSKRMGPSGIDILYLLMTTRGGSKAAKLASRLLQDPKVVARGTPALQVAVGLKRARSCEDVEKLFPNLKKHGDNRSLGQIQIMRGSKCQRYSANCCLPDNDEVKALVKAMEKN